MLHARRDAANLLPLFRQYVVPGTTIVSDQWATDFTIKDVPDGYQHEAVNHCLNFIHHETGAYTDSIQSLWQKFKEGHKLRYGTERTQLNLYMDEFIWKKMCGAMRCTISGPK